MKKNKILALLLAILLPLTGYWLVKYYSKDAVHMPNHYFYDSVGEKSIRGKKVSDTNWHQVKNISFTNQLGKKVSLDDLKGKIIVLDFFFTHCPTICPGMAMAMKKLQKSFEQNPEIVQFISISVDPEHDSVPQLRKFADKLNINHDTWWFVTGDKKEIYDFAINEIKANIADTDIDTAFIHTENIFLLDSNRVVRGWYNGFDTVKQARLVMDIPTIMLERDKKSPSLLREFIPYLPVIFIGIGLTILAVTLLNRIKNKDNAATNI
ncbi:MAG: SCO family protein [Bacteroidota bacterium]